MKEAQDNNKLCATVLTDLSKAFYCLLQDLLMAICEILQIIYGVPQGLILGPLLFKVNLLDLTLADHYKSDFYNYVDDTTF